MCPLSPTATMRAPARTASLRRLAGARSVWRAGASMISASANAAGADQTMESPRQAAPRVLHINLLAIQIAYYVVLTVCLWPATPAIMGKVPASADTSAAQGGRRKIALVRYIFSEDPGIGLFRIQAKHMITAGP